MRFAKDATVYGLDVTVRARILRVSAEEPRPVRSPGVAVAVEKAASPMRIAARKIKPPAAFAGPPGSEQKARVNSAAKTIGNARK